MTHPGLVHPRPARLGPGDATVELALAVARELDEHRPPNRHPDAAAAVRVQPRGRWWASRRRMATFSGWDATLRRRRVRELAPHPKIGTRREPCSSSSRGHSGVQAQRSQSPGPRRAGLGGRARDGHRVPRGRRGDAGPGRRMVEKLSQDLTRAPAVRVRLKAEALVHGGDVLAPTRRPRRLLAGRRSGRHGRGGAHWRGPGSKTGARAPDPGAGRGARGSPLRHRRSLRRVPRAAPRLPDPARGQAGSSPRTRWSASADFPVAATSWRPSFPSPLQFRYRRRARLHRAPEGAGIRAARPGPGFEPVDECLLFEPHLRDLADLARGAGELPGVT